MKYELISMIEICDEKDKNAQTNIFWPKYIFFIIKKIALMATTKNMLNKMIKYVRTKKIR